MKRLLSRIPLFIIALLLFSCEKKNPDTPGPIPSGLEIKGDAIVEAP